MTNQREELAKPFDPSVLKKVNKSGAKLDYIPVSEVIARLNLVLGTENWSTSNVKVWADELYPEWILAQVTVTASIDQVVTTKTGVGGQKVKMLKSGDGPVDLGDEYKGAQSDAFKKACQQLGVGLELARTEEARELEEEERERIKLEGEPKATPEDIVELEKSIKALNEDQSARSKAWWKEQGFPGLKTGKLTVSQAEEITTYLQELVEGEKPFTDE